MNPTRSVDTRNKLVEVAEKEFALSGYAGAHLQRIAEQVGVQKTALYYYFPSKAALYVAVLDRIVRALDDTFAAAIEGEAPHPERLERLIDDTNALLSEHPYYSRILLRIFVDRAPEEVSTIQPTIERLIGRLLRFYRDGAEQGALRRISARHVFLSLLGATLFHYAAPRFSAAVLGVDDVFTRNAVQWRRNELLRLLSKGVLRDASGPGSEEED